MTPKNLFKKNTKVVYHVMGDEVFILDEETDQIITLNKTGKTVWLYLDKKRSLEDIVAYIKSIYEGNGLLIKKDITKLLTNLLKRKIITISSD